MNVLFLMIPVSILLAFVFLGLFIWSNNNDQFDDLDGAAQAILEDDMTTTITTTTLNSSNLKT